MRPLSLRSRLVVVTVGLVALGLLTADVAGLALFQSFQLQRVDDQLQVSFGSQPPKGVQNQLANLCTAGRGADAPQLPTNFTIMTFDPAGRLTCQLPQPSPLPATLGSLSAEELANAASSQQTITITPDGGRAPLMRARVLQLDDGYGVLAISLAEVGQSVGRLGLISIIVGVIILGAATLTGIFLVRVGLRPLTAIEHAAEDIAAGNISRRIQVDSDKTEVGRLGTSLNSMLSQIEAAFAERDRTEGRLRRFVADASHELRTPLATVRGHAELVRNGIASSREDIERVISRIESESIRMSSLVDDLLLLARLDTTRVLERRPVDLLSVTADCVADARAREPQRQITIRNPTDPPWLDSPPTVMGDSVRLQQMLTNLLSNAVKHTPTGTTIEVEVGAMGDNVQLAVIDHGPGLQSGNEERVFERFFREDLGRTRGIGGAGLGLAITYSLADKHGGHIRYKPTAGGGSTFELKLPLAQI